MTTPAIDKGADMNTNVRRGCHVRQHGLGATKPTRVKLTITKSTPAASTDAKTFTTVSLANEFKVEAKTLRAKVRRHINALKPLMTAPHVYPTKNRAAVLKTLSLA